MNKLNFLLLFFFISFSSQTFAQEKASFDVAYTDQVLRKEIQKILIETGIPSISVTLVQDNSVLFSKAYGYANVKKKVPASTSTI